MLIGLAASFNSTYQHLGKTSLRSGNSLISSSSDHRITEIIIAPLSVTELLFNNYSSSPNGAIRGYSATQRLLRGYQGERNNCFSKISKISFSKVDQKDIEITNPFLPPKHYKYGGPVSVKRRLQTGGKTKTGGKMQTADCRPGVKCRLSAN